MKRVALSFFVLFLLFSTFVHAGETVLYRFQGGSDGYRPNGPLVADAAGNLYGTTFYGGDAGCQFLCGTVFELSPDGHGGWAEAVLYQFTGGADGQNPVAGLTIDGQGNLYGTTGGAACPPKCGSAFELSPGSNGWTFTVLHTFLGKNDGGGLAGGLTMDGAGNLYGTTIGHGAGGHGTVFRLSPVSNGWALKTLRTFDSDQYGADPQGSLILNPTGTAIYGSTTFGGAAGWGVVYRLAQNRNGHWTEKVLYSFPGGTGPGNPIDGVSSDSGGNLYGVATNVADKRKLIYRLSRNLQGKWTEKTIFHFHFSGDPDGASGNVFIDETGTAFGFGGADRSSSGSIYDLSRSGHTWIETLIYSLQGSSGGIDPVGPPIMDTNGNLYGVTDQGGAGCSSNGGCGVVFEFTP